MVGCTKLVAAMIMAALVVASLESEIRVGAETCDTLFWKCEGVCYKSGKCNACCKQIGYLAGKCNFWKGMACYCCHEDHAQNPPPLAN